MRYPMTPCRHGHRWVAGAFCVVLASAAVVAAGSPAQGGGRGIQAPPPVAAGQLAGVVVIAASGLPLDGVRVTLSGAELAGSRSATTDDDGRFVFAGLPAGRFTLSASKPGFVGVTYGQRQPGGGRAGTPIQLVHGQTIANLRVSIPAGGVITGTVFDDKGRPAVGTQVRVSRWSMATGERRLVSAGSASADDRGSYRAYGLAPGAYVVHAVPRNPSASQAVTAEVIEVLGRDAAAGATWVTTGTGGGVVVQYRDGAMTPGENADVSLAFAPVYYPGTLDLASTQSIEIGVSEERAGVDLHLQQVPVATVQGRVIAPPGIAVTNVRLRLVSAAEGAPGVSTPATRADRDGAFTFRSVPPGQYRLVAVASVRNLPAAAVGAAVGGEPLPPGSHTMQFWAAANVSVHGRQVPGVTLVMQAGMIVSGQVAFEGTARLPPADLRRVRLTLSPDSGTSADGVSSMSTALDDTGRFRFVGVVPGRYRIRASSGAGGWWPRTALAGGRDALDFLLTVPANESVPNVMLTLSDRAGLVSGMLQDAMLQPTSEYTVVLFSAESHYWLPLSRRIRAARPGTDGRFSFGDLPAGEYRLAAVTDVEPGGWYDPEFLRQLLGASVPVRLAEGEQRVQNLRVAGR